MNTTVYPTTITALESTPDSTDLWDISAMFLADWSAGIKVASGWMTDVVASKDGKESRQGLLGRPRRTIGFSLKAWQAASIGRIRSILARAGMARSLIPLYCDFTKLTSAALATATTIYCDTTNRRFFVGGYVIIASPTVLSINLTSYEIKQIATVYSDRLVLSTGLSANRAAGSRVYPACETQLNPDTEFRLVTDQVGETYMEFKEIVGKTALPAQQEGDDETGFTTVSGYPVLDFDFAWPDMQSGFKRSSQTSPIGYDQYFEVYGNRPMSIFHLHFKIQTRDEIFRFFKFWDSRRGRLYPFWLVSPATELNLTSTGTLTSTIAVTATGAEKDWDMRTYLAIVMRDGTIYIRGKNGAVVRAAGIDTVTLSTNLPSVSASQIRRVTTAYLVRFDSDELTENWVTDEFMLVDLPVIEVTDAVVSLDITSNPDGDPTGPGTGYGGGGDDPIVSVDSGTGEDGTLDPVSDVFVEKYMLFRKARRCLTGEAVDLWMRASDVKFVGDGGGPWGIYYDLGGGREPFYFSSGDAMYRSHGPLYTGGMSSGVSCSEPSCSGTEVTSTESSGCPNQYRVELSGLTGDDVGANSVFYITKGTGGYKNVWTGPAEGPGPTYFDELTSATLTSINSSGNKWQIVVVLDSGDTITFVADRTTCCLPSGASWTVASASPTRSDSPALSVLFL